MAETTLRTLLAQIEARQAVAEPHTIAPTPVRRDSVAAPPITT